MSGACSGGTKPHRLTLQEMIAADPLPLAKGSKWTYDVTVRRFDADADKETAKTLTWTTEVVDAKEGTGIPAHRADDPALRQQLPVRREPRAHARRRRRLVLVARDGRPEDLPQAGDGLLLASVGRRHRLCPLLLHRPRRADVRARARHRHLAFPLRAPRHDERSRRHADDVRQGRPLARVSMSRAKTILLVEDNPDDVELTLRAFQRNNIGNEVLVASDGEEALDYVFATGKFADRDPAATPTLILLDLKLPKVMGLDVLRKIRADVRK